MCSSTETPATLSIDIFSLVSYVHFRLYKYIYSTLYNIPIDGEMAAAFIFGYSFPVRVGGIERCAVRNRNAFITIEMYIHS